jgi:hypothetical protein
MPVHDVIGLITVPTLAHDLGETPQEVDVGRVIEGQGLIIINALTRTDFVFDMV